jgi:hypothetical protein
MVWSPISARGWVWVPLSIPPGIQKTKEDEGDYDYGEQKIKVFGVLAHVFKHQYFSLK